MKILTLSGLLLSSLCATAQDEPPDINLQFKANQAIKKGVAFLKGKRIGKHGHTPSGNELILLTYLHADVPEDDADLQALLKHTLNSKLENTYRVALTAMCLEELDRAKYQGRIHQCAQFLADNVGPAGQTRYGKPTEFKEDNSVATGSFRRSVKSGVSARSRGEKPDPPRTIYVKQKRPGPADADHSNMQYAALGFRACHDAGIRFEKPLIVLCLKWWKDHQEQNENAKKEGLSLDPPRRRSFGGASRVGVTRTQVLVAPQGWGYTGSKGAKGSMTAGAIGAMCIYRYILGSDWRRDTDILEGLQWLNKNYTVTQNPKAGGAWHYYYLYGLERAGMLYGTEMIGNHRWYKDGANYLISKQNGNGSWGGGKGKGAAQAALENTCFAILFLKRATQRLDVASTDGSR